MTLEATYYIDQRIEEMSDDEITRVYNATLKAVSDDVYDPESDEFMDEFNNQLKLSVAKDDISKLEADNDVFVSGINDSGELQYTVTE